MRVLVDGCLTQPVPVSQGVRQGDPLSPVLFLIFIDALAEMLAERCKGLAYSPEGPATRRQLRSLLYADDVVMLAESPEELNAMIEVVRSFCDTWRIEINLTKSQVMEVHPRGVCRKAEGYYYGSKAIEVVKQYKYLGLMLTDTLSWDAHHERALAKARKGHVALARLFARREIPFAAKRAMWTTTTLSSLEYGAEGVWGTLFSIAIIYVNDYQTYLEHGLLYGYTGMVWCVIMNQALGGLIIAMVIKYADNIVKCFAVALSIILGAVLTAVFFDFEPTLQFVGGTVLVVGSVIMYSELPVMQEFITKLFASPKTKGYSSVQQTELEKV
eukprot:g27005.t1